MQRARMSSGDSPCRCGHAYRAHEHYRKGSDCALCVCERFKMPTAAVLRLPRILRRPRSAAA